MELEYLWDTNTVIYFLQQQFSAPAEQFIDRTLQRSVPAISVITEIELLAWRTASDSDLQVIQSFLRDVQIYELDPEIKYRAAKLRRTDRIKLPDAIIAATALCQNLILLTRNTKDFQSVPDLKIINPYDQ